MIHKVTVKGYNNVSPFKLFYLADNIGLSDLSESFKLLLLLPIESKDKKDLVRSWVMSTYLAKEDRLKNAYISSYNVTTEEYESLLAENKRQLKECQQLQISIKDELEPILSVCDYLVTPVTSKKGVIKSVVNTKCSLSREAFKREKQLSKLNDYAGYGNYYTNQINYLKSLNLKQASWTIGSKLILNGQVKKHPCVMCPNALEQLEGLCSFGGSLCAEKLTQVLNPKTEA